MKRERAFAMFAAEYLLFKKANETDDTLLIGQSYKRIRQILEEAAPLLSDTPVPDSFIWRLWHYIERANRQRAEMEKVRAIFMKFLKHFKFRFIYLASDHVHFPNNSCLM
jgi:hypothetical protein